ncbi:ankyrin-1-like [Physella acuta]|uniref:ankyrin-1-like n=1 Tax=Physella acuta TaxID=109671 RepID=UPI0027DD5178|nr:ankyrin-1-like [Physella acuta]
MRNLTLIKNILTMNKQMVTQPNDKFETALQHFLKTILEDGIKTTTNDLSIIEYLLKAQGNTKNSKQKFTNSSSESPVQLACLIGDDNILLLLLKYGAELDTASYDDEDEPLMIAAKCGHAKILEILLAKGSKIHRRSLQLAVKKGHTDCAQILLDALTKTNIKVAAQICIEECDVSLLRYLTEKFNIEIQDKYFLWVAIARGNKEIVNFLIERGADVNATYQGHFRLSWKKSTRLFTPLGHAAYHKHTEVLKTLLASGADTGGVDDDGNTALFYCVENDDIDGTRQLLEAGANVNHRNIKGYTPLLYALAKKCGKTESCNYNTKGVTAALISMVQLLIGYGADVNISNNENITCLLLLPPYSEKENIEMLKILIEQGALLDTCDAGGNTALILASKCRNVKMMKELLHAGAEVNALNFDDKTALSSIFHYERYGSVNCEALDLLLSYGGVLSGVESRTAVYTLIQDSIDQQKNVVKILGKGVYPYTFENESGSSLDFYIPSDLEAVTPVSYALVRKKPDTAKYLFSKSFLTLYDVQTIQHSKQFRDYLVQQGHVTSTDVYDAIFGQPLTLFTLSFVVVSASLGVDFDRQERVNRLPIPQAIKRKLLFQDLQD